MVTRLRSHYKIQARNFVQEEAEKRMKEIVSAAQQQSSNAIFVHATPILYFMKVESNLICPCRERVVVSDQLPFDVPGTSKTFIDIDATTSLFGSFQASKDILGEMMDDDLVNPDMPSNQVTMPSIFGNATECPICFRTGTIPGYELVGHYRQVLCYCEDSLGYYLDSSKSVPLYSVDNQEQGYVEFKLNVPLIFSEVKIGVYALRENVTSLAGLKIGNQPLDVGLLEQLKGQTVRLRISKVSFTHAVFQFKTSDTPVLADFPQDQKPQDYNLFDTTQPSQVVMDKTVPDVNNSDLLVKIPYATLWKVSDFEYLRLRDRTVIGWSLNARIVQKDEIFNKILDIHHYH